MENIGTDPTFDLTRCFPTLLRHFRTFLDGGLFDQQVPDDFGFPRFSPARVELVADVPAAAGASVPCTAIH